MYDTIQYDTVYTNAVKTTTRNQTENLNELKINRSAR